VGLWDQLRTALSVWWTEWQGSDVDAQTQRLTWLNGAWRAEQRLATELRHIAPAVPYEHFRTSLEAMARDDEHHAELLRERLEAIGSLPRPYAEAGAFSANSHASRPWRGLLGVLTEKRELYERYRQEAVFLDDADLRSLVERIRLDEARHQEQLVEILTHLDAHVHDTIT
jgi:rubrerythrin